MPATVSRIRPRTRRIAVAAIPFLLLAACSSGGSKVGSGTTSPGGATSPTAAAASLAGQCPNGAVAQSAQKPIQITLWHSMTQANLKTLVTLTDQFNASHPDIHVNLVNQTSYIDTLTKYKATLGGGPRPDLVQIQDVDQQLMIDTKSVLPVQACFEAKHLDTSDFVPRAISYYTVRGVDYSIPFAMSNPVLYYNKAAFQKAGLDPNKPPKTLDELRQDAQQIVSSGADKYGIALKNDPWHLEEWSAMAGALYANNGNGRDKRATAVEFGGATGQQIYSWISGMARDKLAESTTSNGFDNLFAVANKVAAMTIDTSAALGTIFDVLGSGQYKDIQLGVAPLPGPVAGGPTIQAGSSLFVISGTSPAREEAAFTFAEWLSEGPQQAVWSAGTGYVPVRTSATTQPVLQQAWTARPQLRIAYDQILSGANTQAAQGPVIGDMEGVRTAVENAETSLFQGADPTSTMQKLVSSANSVISDYESRVS